MTIAGMVKSSLIDYPGLISCVLFVPGCNLNCFYCHNRYLIDGSNDVLEFEDIKDYLIKRKGLLDGVVITGGEPTLQNDLISFLKSMKSFGYKIKLDTNGTSPNVVKEILKNDLCDYFAVDYKAPAARYEEVCGTNANANNVLKTINLLYDNNANFEVRTTVIPQLKVDDLIQMAKELPAVPKYSLNRYRMPEKYLPCDKDRVEKKPYSQNEINEFASIIKNFQSNVTA